MHPILVKLTLLLSGTHISHLSVCKMLNASLLLNAGGHGMSVCARHHMHPIVSHLWDNRELVVITLHCQHWEDFRRGGKKRIQVLMYCSRRKERKWHQLRKSEEIRSLISVICTRVSFTWEIKMCKWNIIAFYNFEIYINLFHACSHSRSHSVSLSLELLVPPIVFAFLTF